MRLNFFKKKKKKKKKYIYIYIYIYKIDIGGFFDREALQEYILLCCQNQYGGLIDKPRK